jgi:hypothetical protein
MPANGALAARLTCAVDVDADDAAGDVLVGVVDGTDTADVRCRCPPLPLAQPTARTVTNEATVAPVMLSRCHRVSRRSGDGTWLLRLDVCLP